MGNTFSTALVNTTGTTEGVALTTPAVSTGLSGPPGGVYIDGSINLLTGAGGTLVTIKCRQGTAITGTQVGGTHTVTTVAATNVEIPFSFIDTAPVAANSQYSITVTENAGTWTAQFGCITTDTMTGYG
jgi:hypothetical protein